MPFVTPRGGEKLNWDITYDRHDPKTGELTQTGNRLRELELCGGVAFDYRTNTSTFKEVVWRGQPNTVEMNWNELPVYRVLTNRFQSGYVKPEIEEEYLKTDWGRFMRDYEKQVKGILPTAVFYYEPDIADIRIDSDLNYHFPMWVIDQLIKWKEFEVALKINKVNLPGVMRLTQSEYDRIMKEIEVRREIENGNVSGRSKQGASKAG